MSKRRGKRIPFLTDAEQRQLQIFRSYWGYVLRYVEVKYLEEHNVNIYHITFRSGFTIQLIRDPDNNRSMWRYADHSGEVPKRGERWPVINVETAH